MRISRYIDAPARSVIFIDASIFLYALTSGPVRVVPKGKKVRKQWERLQDGVDPEVERQVKDEREEEPGYGDICRELLEHGFNGKFHIFTTTGVLGRVVEVAAQIRSRRRFFVKKRKKESEEAAIQRTKEAALKRERRWAFSCMAEIAEYLTIVSPIPDDYQRAAEIVHLQEDLPVAWALDLAGAEREAHASPENPLRIASFSARANDMVNGDREGIRKLIFAPYIARRMEREVDRRRRVREGVVVEPSLSEEVIRKQAAARWHPYFPGFAGEKRDPPLDPLRFLR